MTDKPKAVPILDEEVDATINWTGACSELADMGLYSPDNEDCPWLTTH
tara:strand:+ start:1976 stop:2119 length:144 start_codon:yes stop_codon:yes gene_type:complete